MDEAEEKKLTKEVVETMDELKTIDFNKLNETELLKELEKIKAAREHCALLDAADSKKAHQTHGIAYMRAINFMAAKKRECLKALAEKTTSVEKKDEYLKEARRKNFIL